MRRETKTWAGRLPAAVVVVVRARLRAVPSVRAVRAGQDHHARPRPGGDARPQPRAAAENDRLEREAGALRRTGRRSSGSRAPISAGCARARSSSTWGSRRQRPRHEGAPLRTDRLPDGAVRPRGAGVRRLRRVPGAVLARLVPRSAPAGRRSAPGGRGGGADRPPGVQDPGARAHLRAAPHPSPRGDLRRGAGAAAADDGLSAAGVLGRRHVGDLSARLRGGQLPRHLPSAVGRAAAGRGGGRLRGGALVRSQRLARGGGRLPGARRLHRRLRAA